MAKEERKHKRRVILDISTDYAVSTIGAARLKRYIADAVETWGGQLHPDDALFYGVSVHKVQV
jgi:hypothetical protein